MKILIIAYYYPPETYARMASLRPYSWAKYWSEMGHKVRVLTTYKGRNQEELEPFPNIKIEEVNHIRFSFSKKKQSHDITQTTSQGESFFKNTIRQNLIFFQKELGLGTLLYGSNLWALPAYYHSLKLHQTFNFDLIVSTFSPPASHIVAHLLKRKYNQFWVADYRDLWSDYSFFDLNTIVRAIEKRYESFFIQNANLLCTVSDPLNLILKKGHNKPVITIENGFEPESIICQSQNINTSKIKLIYTGSIYPDKRDPIALFKSLNYLNQANLENLEIYFAGYNSEYLKQLNDQFNSKNIINFLGFIPGEECLKLQASADLLIFLDWNDPNIEGILTGKIFEYMVAGTSVINIGCDHETDASRLITEAGIGVNLGNDPQVIAAYLKRLLQGEKPYYQPNQAVIEKYSRKKLAEKMLEQILHYKNQWDSNQT